ncbi:MAG: DNA methyltransferase [Candidatus Symbiobacter sp.]|nr:DNA methyltransferase [Candidatus Symbiobacter sp.]
MFTNTLYTQDNLFVLHGMNSDSVDLIYLDPPFNSKRLYAAPVGSRAAGAAFKDMWGWSDVNAAYLERLIEKYPNLGKFILATKETHSNAMAAYLAYMAQRIIEMHRVLKDTGSFYLHCDPTASHYLKFLLDAIFGRDNFRNEIIWCYSIGGKSKRTFGRKHDVILYYSKSDAYFFDAAGASIPRKPNSHMKSGVDEDGRDYQEKTDKKSGKTYRYYVEDGKIAEDYWTDIESLNREDRERTGYPTQKPLALLHRIIKASSREGDIVLDPFCGCATTCVAAQQLNRHWIGIDIEQKSSAILIERLSGDAGMFRDFIHRTDIPHRTDVALLLPSNDVKTRLYAAQNKCCNGCGSEFDLRHFDIDHIVPKAKGGGDYYENFQLLCASCHRIKGDRPMEYLMTRLRTIEKSHAKISFGD